MAVGAHAVPRRRDAGHAAIRVRTLELIFQSYPGTEAAAAVSGLDYEVQVGRGPVRRGTTAVDGKITLRLPAGVRAQVTVMGTVYQITARGALESQATVRGQQRRLNMLGYNAGGADGINGPKTEYAVLNFQADHSPLLVDGLAGPRTQQALHNAVGE